MLAMFLMVAAAAPDRLRPLLTAEDYPSWAVASEVSAAALVDVLIDPQGKVVRCETVTTYGPAKLAREVCQAISRKRLSPTRTAEGQPIHVALRTLMRFYLPETSDGKRVRALQQPSDVLLTVTSLPSGAKSARVSVDLLVDESGGVISCEPLIAGSEATLAAAACKARGQLGISKMVDNEGKAIRYMTTRKIEFSVEPQTPSPPRDSSGANPR